MNRAGFGAESEASQATGGAHEENLLNQVMKDKQPKTFAGNQIGSGTHVKDGCPLSATLRRMMCTCAAKPDVQTPVRCLQVLDASAQCDGY